MSSQDQELWYLKNIDVTGIFCSRKAAEMTDAEVMLHTEFKKGDYIYVPDDKADCIFLIFEGRVKVGTYSEQGKEILKTVLTKGEVFGEMAVVGQTTRRDFAMAMEKTTICILPVDQIQAMMRDRNGLTEYLMRIIGSRALTMERRLESLVFKDSRTRVIEFLRELAQERGQRVGYEVVVRNFLTHQEIANLTATSRQTVTTILKELRAENIITFNRRRMLVRDMDKLV